MLLLLVNVPHAVLAPPTLWPAAVTPRTRLAREGSDWIWSFTPPERLRLNVVKLSMPSVLAS